MVRKYLLMEVMIKRSIHTYLAKRIFNDEEVEESDVGTLSIKLYCVHVCVVSVTARKQKHDQDVECGQEMINDD